MLYVTSYYSYCLQIYVANINSIQNVLNCLVLSLSLIKKHLKLKFIYSQFLVTNL